MDKINNLISILDSYKFGGYSLSEVHHFIDLMIDEASGDFLELLLTIRFSGICDDYLKIAKEYKDK